MNIKSEYKIEDDQQIIKLDLDLSRADVLALDEINGLEGIMILSKVKNVRKKGTFGTQGFEPRIFSSEKKLYVKLKKDQEEPVTIDHDINGPNPQISDNLNLNLSKKIHNYMLNKSQGLVTMQYVRYLGLKFQVSVSVF